LLFAKHNLHVALLSFNTKSMTVHDNSGILYFAFSITFLYFSSIQLYSFCVQDVY